MSADILWFFAPKFKPRASSHHRIAADAFGLRNLWGLPLLGLSGRAGLGLGLALTYNSLVWTKDGSAIKFNADNGFPAPGFRLGFPTIQPRYFNSQVGVYAYMMILPSGARVELRQVGTTNLYEAADSFYLQFDAASLIARAADGTQLSYTLINTEYRCTQIKDRNGNFITVVYDVIGHIDTITDTLGRVITFNYDGIQNPISITQSWNGVTHTWATFGYGSQVIQTNYPGLSVVGPSNGTAILTLTQVGLDDGSRYVFTYNSYGQVYVITGYAADGHELNHTTYNLPVNANVAQTDCPRFTVRGDYAENWNNGSEVATNFSFGLNNTSGQVTMPDLTVYKEYFSTTGYQKGLTTQTEIWSQSVRKKWTTITWTQDNPSASYILNPRVTETNVYDDAGNRRRATLSYQTFTLPSGASCSLPSDTYEYQADATTVLRRAHTDYNLSSSYLSASRRLLGLPSAQYLYDGNNTLLSKVDYQYDLSGTYLQNQGAAVNHDEANYGSGFVAGRGNLCIARRYDVNFPTDTTKAASSSTGYNTTGSAIFASDALGHQTTISYADSFAATGTPSAGTTLAYATTVTDAEGFAATAQYDYDLGAVRQAQDPKGAVQTTTYDAAGRVARTDVSNGAYTRFVYATTLTSVNRFTLINAGGAEFYSNQVVDGAGRAISARSDHPSSTGRYKGVYVFYDTMGRVYKQTNPTEVTNTDTPAGDDAGGVAYSYQTYDWKGRARVTTNQDGTTREMSYGGCGCAGGEVVTARDELNRQQRTTYDVVGRVAKSEVLNWDLSVYSTTINTYNGRDQVTQVCQQAGPVTGTTCSATAQVIQMSYDGHARLKTRQAPIESAPTTYDYYADDTVQKRTDPRGATATFTYNARHLLTGIDYRKPQNAPESPIGDPNAIPNAADVDFGYDAAGNRVWMTDGQGRVDYVYDTWSRLTSETRTFNDLSGSWPVSYSYNLAGEVKTITDPFNSVITYTYDPAGQLTDLTGTGYPGVTQMASTLRYRAWGVVKHMTYGNGRVADLSYNSRQLITSYSVSGFGKTYDYYSDGRVKTVTQVNGNAAFNRRYVYDHAGRLAQGLTGRGAQEPPLPPDANDPDPYNQSYQYDVWNNLVTRNNTFWNHAENPFIGNFVNDRNSNWTYDAAGNVKTDDTGGHFNYNSAGQMSDTTINSITQKYDGDGQAARKTESHYDSIRGIVVTNVIYYVRSSVLGGQAVVELNDVGQKRNRYIYANGGVIAREKYVAFPSSYVVVWRHDNPVTQERIETGTNGNVNASLDLDPLGGLVPPVDPFAGNGNPDYGSLLGDREAHQDDADPFEPGTGCTLDGVPINCNVAVGLANHGGAVVAPLKTVVGTTGGRLAVWQPGGGYWAYNPSQPINTGGGSDGDAVKLGVSDVPAWKWVGVDPNQQLKEALGENGLLRVGFQGGGFLIGQFKFSEDEMSRLKSAYDRITSDGCKQFFDETVGLAWKDGIIPRDPGRPVTLDGLLQITTLNRYNPNLAANDVRLPRSYWADVQATFDRKGIAFTSRYDGRIFLGDQAFHEASFFGRHFRGDEDTDLPGNIVHEFFHRAGFKHGPKFPEERDIQKNCGEPGKYIGPSNP